MDICKNLNSIKYFEKSVLTIGSFDGMHCGHLEIIRDLQTIAKKKNHPSIVITFDPHRYLFYKNMSLQIGMFQQVLIKN